MIIWLCWRLIAVGWFVLLVQLLFTMFGLNNVVAVVWGRGYNDHFILRLRLCWRLSQSVGDQVSLSSEADLRKLLHLNRPIIFSYKE